MYNENVYRACTIIVIKNVLPNNLKLTILITKKFFILVHDIRLPMIAVINYDIRNMYAPSIPNTNHNLYYYTVYNAH